MDVFERAWGFRRFHCSSHVLAENRRFPRSLKNLLPHRCARKFRDILGHDSAETNACVVADFHSWIEKDAIADLTIVANVRHFAEVRGVFSPPADTLRLLAVIEAVVSCH